MNELQGKEKQPTFPAEIEEYSVLYQQGDGVAFKHNYRKYIDPFSLVVLSHHVHHNCDSFLEKHVKLQRLELSGEDNIEYRVRHPITTTPPSA